MPRRFLPDSSPLCIHSMAETRLSVNAHLRICMSEYLSTGGKSFHTSGIQIGMKRELFKYFALPAYALIYRPLPRFLTMPFSSIISSMDDTSRALIPDCSIMSSTGFGS